MRNLVLFLTLLLALPASAQDRDFALPGDSTCPIDLPDQGPPGGWTEAEAWAWQQICLGKWANMRYAGPGGYDGLACKPWEIDGEVPAHRTLRPEFLHLILTRAPWTTAPAKPQVIITCAVIERQIDLENATVAPELFLANSHVPSAANLLGAHFDRTLSFQGSRFEAKLNADSLSVGGSLFLRGGASFQEVDLVGAKVAGNVEADGSTFADTFQASNLSVGGSLFLRGGASFQEVDLRGGKVAGNVDANGSTFAGEFNADSLSVGGSLFLRGGASFQEVVLLGAKVAGNVETDGSTFAGEFNADRLSVGGGLFLHGGASFQEVDLLGAKVAGSVSAAGSTFAGKLDADLLSVGGDMYLRRSAAFEEVDLLGAKIDGHLQLNGSMFSGEFDFSGGSADELVLFGPGTMQHHGSASDDPIWQEGATLILRNATVAAVQSRPSSWAVADGPLPTDLGGFTYQRLEGFRAGMAGTLLDLSGAEFVDWLTGLTAQTTDYDPQPYEQLAKVLDDAGMTEKAKAIRYAKFRHRDAVKPGTWWQTILIRPASRVVIGYGVYPFLALAWFAGLVAVGWLVAFASKADPIKPWWRKFWYSLENALPLVEFSEQHKLIDHGNGLVESWFHLQKVLGFVLATVLIGALSLLGG